MVGPTCLNVNFIDDGGVLFLRVPDGNHSYVIVLGHVWSSCVQRFGQEGRITQTAMSEYCNPIISAVTNPISMPF